MKQQSFTQTAQEGSKTAKQVHRGPLTTWFSTWLFIYSLEGDILGYSHYNGVRKLDLLVAFSVRKGRYSRVIEKCVIETFILGVLI